MRSLEMERDVNKRSLFFLFYFVVCMRHLSVFVLTYRIYWALLTNSENTVARKWRPTTKRTGFSR